MSRTEIPSTQTSEGSELWTLEEISRLVSHSGSPAETLTNIVHLIRRRFDTDVCSVYLLEPDRSSLVLAATIGLRPESVGRIRMRLDEGLAGLVAEQMQPAGRRRRHRTSAIQVFREAGEDSYHSFLGVPVDRSGILQGVLVVQTIEPRAFGQDDVRMLVMAGTQLAPIVSEARTLGQFVAPTHQRLSALAQNLWWSWDNDATTLFRQLDPVLWRESDTIRWRSCSRCPIEKIEERASELALHSRINYAYRRMQEYLESHRTWGDRHAGVLWARPVAYFSAEFGLHESMPIYSGGLGILAGDHIKSASDLGIPLDRRRPLLRPGLFQAAAGPRRLAARGLYRRRQPLAAHSAGHEQRRADSRVDRHTDRHDQGPCLEAGRRTQDAAAARLERRWQPARRPRADGSPVWWRSSCPDPAGAVARHRRRARSGGDGHLARRHPPE